MNEQQILDALRNCVYRPEAEHTYDVLAGGLMWADETPERDDSGAFLACVLYLRKIIAYRASLTEGHPRTEFRAQWDELKASVPGWPGFRQERISSDKAKRLLAFIRRQEDKCLDSLEDEGHE